MARLVYLIATFSVFYFFLPNSLEEEDLCNEQIEVVVDCWLHYGDPPSCKRKSSMVLCAEERFDSVLNCSSATLRKIRRMVFGYGAIEDALCKETSNLHTEIQSRKSCWPILRSCGLQVMMVEPNEAEECRGVMNVLSTCSRISHSCSNVYNPFIKLVINRSNCKDFTTATEEEASAEDPLQQFFTNKAKKKTSFALFMTIFIPIFISIYL